tara:strand:- start:994 stop:1689 length:696 start_codon:yes stop_codon:yes gene_type:complete
METIHQVVILAGGKGTRMREVTEELPKPMVKVGDIPVIEHLINIFQQYGNFNFLICSGYLEEIIFDYFQDWHNVKVLSTGGETNTGGRIFKIRQHLDDNFIVTYGDGLANVNINNLIQFHIGHQLTGTITVANPISRFGLVEFDSTSLVNDFIEKPKLEGFVNIGFMAFKKSFLSYLNEDSILELDPIINLTKDGGLKAFVHEGYFEPMDTYREYLSMNELWSAGKPPWLN